MLDPMPEDAPAPDAADEGLERRWTVLALLLLAYFFSSVDRMVMGIMVQPIKASMLLADWQIGFLSGFAFNLIFLVFGLAVAKLVDQKNRVTILTICIAFWSLMTAACGLSANFIQLCLLRMGVGVGEAGCLPASHSLISDYFPRSHRTRALAVYGLGYPLGGMLGSIFVGFLLDHLDWRTAFAIIGLPGLLVAVMTWRGIDEPQRGRFDRELASDRGPAVAISYADLLRLLWRSPVLRQMIIALTLVSIFTSPTATFLGPYLIRRFPVSYTVLGMIVGMSMMFGAAISTIGGSWLAQWMARRDQRWLMWVPAITIALGAIPYIIALSQSDWLPFALWMFLGAVINATYLAPSYTVLYNTIPPGGRAKATVIVNICMGLIGLGIGPLLAGAANDLLASILFGRLNPGRSFLTTCPGGEAAQGASATLHAACHGAMVDATPIVLIATLAMTVWAAVHFYLAGRKMGRPHD